MPDIVRHYINGTWTEPTEHTQPIVNPATGQITGQLGLGTPQDTEAAIAAARAAFSGWSTTSIAERAAVLDRIAEVHAARADDMAAAITADMGMPIGFAGLTVAVGADQFRYYGELIRTYPFVEELGTTRVLKVPSGSAGSSRRGTTPACSPRRRSPPRSLQGRR